MLSELLDRMVIVKDGHSWNRGLLYKYDEEEGGQYHVNVRGMQKDTSAGVEFTEDDVKEIKIEKPLLPIIYLK